MRLGLEFVVQHAVFPNKGGAVDLTASRIPPGRWGAKARVPGTVFGCFAESVPKRSSREKRVSNMTFKEHFQKSKILHKIASKIHKDIKNDARRSES